MCELGWIVVGILGISVGVPFVFWLCWVTFLFVVFRG